MSSSDLDKFGPVSAPDGLVVFDHCPGTALEDLTQNIFVDQAYGTRRLVGQRTHRLSSTARHRTDFRISHSCTWPLVLRSKASDPCQLRSSADTTSERAWPCTTHGCSCLAPTGWKAIICRLQHTAVLQRENGAVRMRLVAYKSCLFLSSRDFRRNTGAHTYLSNWMREREVGTCAAFDNQRLDSPPASYD